LRKVSDLREIVMAGIMSTPAIKVDDVVTLTGRVPTADEIKHWIAE
jgi:hypothetical protein